MTIGAEPQAKIVEVLENHPALENWRECGCGEWRAWTKDGPNGNYEEHIAAVLVAALELTQVWSDDVAGPEWQRYSYWRTPTVEHPGPHRLAAGLS